MDFEKYLDKAIEIANKAVEQHGQQAWDTVLFITKLNAVQELVIGFICLAIIINYLLWLKTAVPRFVKGTDDVVDFIRLLFQGLVSAIGFICFITSVLNIWTWVALFKPELYIAKQALETIIK